MSENGTTKVITPELQVAEEKLAIQQTMIQEAQGQLLDMSTRAINARANWTRCQMDLAQLQERVKVLEAQLAARDEELAKLKAPPGDKPTEPKAPAKH
jgi:peptidoglycan hydrolase CwlO-like protein